MNSYTMYFKNRESHFDVYVDAKTKRDAIEKGKAFLKTKFSLAAESILILVSIHSEPIPPKFTPRRLGKFKPSVK